MAYKSAVLKYDFEILEHFHFLPLHASTRLNSTRLTYFEDCMLQLSQSNTFLKLFIYSVIGFLKNEKDFNNEENAEYQIL